MKTYLILLVIVILFIIGLFVYGNKKKEPEIPVVIPPKLDKTSSSPLAKITVFLETSFYNDGLRDAHSDKQSKERGLNSIQTKGQNVCDEVIKELNQKKLHVERQIKDAKDNHLSFDVNQYETSKAIIEADMVEAREKKTQIETNRDLGVYATYQNGFNEYISDYIKSDYNENNQRRTEL